MFQKLKLCCFSFSSLKVFYKCKHPTGQPGFQQGRLKGINATNSPRFAPVTSWLPRQVQQVLSRFSVLKPLTAQVKTGGTFSYLKISYQIRRRLMATGAAAITDYVVALKGEGNIFLSGSLQHSVIH